jgi:translocator protein
MMATSVNAFAVVTPDPTGIRIRLAPIFLVRSPKTMRTTTKNGSLRSSIPSFTHHDSFVQSIKTTTTTTTLTMAATSSTNDNDNTVSSSSSITQVQWGDIAKYIVATAIQFGILKGALYGLDQLVTLVGVIVARQQQQSAAASTTLLLPLALVAVMFMGFSLRSRVASVLDNSRPNRKLLKGKATPSSVKRPTWTPPGIAFPFIWLTITALRGISSALIYRQTQSLHCTPLLAMLLHLSIGDTWNCITNIEERLGVSAVGVLLVWASVWNAIWQYRQILPVAGQILLPSGIWISIATVLTWNIWLLNDQQPLYPTKGNGTSCKWKWSNLGQLQATSIGGGSSSSITASEVEDENN